MSAGILDQVSIGQESSVGVAVTPTVSIAVLPSDGINMEAEPVGVAGIDTKPGLNKAFVPGIKEYPGAYAMNAYPIALGYFLKSALGGVSSTAKAGETIVYEHTFTEEGAKPSLTVEEKNGLIVNNYAGFIVSSLGLELAVGEAVKLNLSGKAMSKTTANAITPSYETSLVFDWTDVTSITLGGTEICSGINSLSLEYVNGLESFHGICDASPKALFVGNSEVTGSFEAYLDSNLATLEDVFEATTEQEMVITIEADETIGVASKNKLVITLPRVVLSSFATPLDTSYVKISANFKAREEAATGLISAVLTNLQTSY